MKIIKIESAIPSFRPVKFNDNFSIVLGIAKSKGEGKSHNLGKTTLISLLDHILFGSRESDRIKAIKANFNNPIFTVLLSLEQTKKEIIVDYSKKRKPIFDASVRQVYEYFLRYQDDYKDEFRRTSIRGKDSTWKPLILRLLGFNDRPLIEKYEVETTISEYENFLNIATSGSMQRARNETEIGRLQERRSAIVESINTLDLSHAEERASIDVAEWTDISIVGLKKELFINRKELSSVTHALAEHTFVDFPSGRVEQIYNDLKIYFGDQIVQDLNDVEDFFSKISTNRATALNAMKKRLTGKIEELEKKLSQLNISRTRQLSFVISKDMIETYKKLSFELSQTEVELAGLTQDIYKESIKTATAEKNLLETEQLKLAAAVAIEIDNNDDDFKKVQKHYNEIMLEVMDIDAEIIIEKNSTGNLTFKTASWRDGKSSEELKGEMAKWRKKYHVQLSTSRYEL